MNNYLLQTGVLKGREFRSWPGPLRKALPHLSCAAVGQQGEVAGQMCQERQPALCPGDLALNLPTPGRVTLAKSPSLSEPVSSSVKRARKWWFEGE